MVGSMEEGRTLVQHALKSLARPGDRIVALHVVEFVPCPHDGSRKPVGDANSAMLMRHVDEVHAICQKLFAGLVKEGARAQVATGPSIVSLFYGHVWRGSQTARAGGPVYLPVTPTEVMAMVLAAAQVGIQVCVRFGGEAKEVLAEKARALGATHLVVGSPAKNLLRSQADRLGTVVRKKRDPGEVLCKLLSTSCTVLCVKKGQVAYESQGFCREDVEVVEQQEVEGGRAVSSLQPLSSVPPSLISWHAATADGTAMALRTSTRDASLLLPSTPTAVPRRPPASADSSPRSTMSLSTFSSPRSEHGLSAGAFEQSPLRSSSAPLDAWRLGYSEPIAEAGEEQQPRGAKKALVRLLSLGKTSAKA
eukprot:SM000097S24775  [mRNA]  locus=s97:233599:235323:+ [translate_table: standard]